MCLLWSLHRSLGWSSVSWLDPVKLGSLYTCRYSVDRIVINLLLLCFCEWYIAETRFCWIPPECAGFVAVRVLVSAGWTLQRAATPASGQVLSLSLELGLLGACPECASAGESQRFGPSLCTEFGSPLLFCTICVLITAAEVALSCVPTCFSSSRWLRLGPALRLKAVIKSLPFSWWLALLLVTLLCLETVGFCRFNLWQGWSAGTAQAQKRKLQSRT